MKVGEIILIGLYGIPTRVKVVKLHAAGTIDVERLTDGRCFRVSGLFYLPGDYQPPAARAA